MKIYLLCRFEYGQASNGYTGDFYLENLDGNVLRYTDLDGNTLDLLVPYGYTIIDSNPPRPSWADPI